MNCCSVCYEDFENQIDALVNGKRIQSLLCIDCITRMKHTRIDNYIESIIKEKCCASLCRIINSPFFEDRQLSTETNCQHT